MRETTYNPQVFASRYGHLELCPDCVACRCGGRTFFYWDEAGNCLPCPCRGPRQRLRITQKRFKTAEIPEKYRWKFRPDFLAQAPDGTPIVGADKLRRSLVRLVEGKEEPRQGLFLHGVPGTGKTHLACILLNELMLHWGRPGRFINLSRSYFQRLRDTFSEDSDQHGQSYQILEELSNLPHLVLDDFGVQRGTEWEEEVLYDLVYARYSGERFTIVTTNEPLEEIERLSKA